MSFVSRVKRKLKTYESSIEASRKRVLESSLVADPEWGWGCIPHRSVKISTHNAPKLAILRSKMKKIWEGHSPLPRPFPCGEWDTPSPQLTPSLLSATRPHPSPPTISGSATAENRQRIILDQKLTSNTAWKSKAIICNLC